MSYESEKINGTLVNYYYTCDREVWLIYHGIESDQEDDNITIGRQIENESYRRDVKQINFLNSKIDIVSKENEILTVSEVKKSSKNLIGTKMQLLYYLKILKEYGIEARGLIRVPTEKKKISVELTQDEENSLNEAIEKIKKLVHGKLPPAKIIHFCKKCAYSEFCWSDEPE